MRKIMLFVFSIFILSFLSSCAKYEPVVDPQAVGGDDSKYYKDRAECRNLASQNTSTAKSAAKDAVIGGAVGTGTGALLGTIAGSTTKGLAYGAVIGGLAGGMKGVYKGNQQYETIYRNCMRGRGYKVLN